MRTIRQFMHVLVWDPAAKVLTLKLHPMAPHAHEVAAEKVLSVIHHDGRPYAPANHESWAQAVQVKMAKLGADCVVRPAVQTGGGMLLPEDYAKSATARAAAKVLCMWCRGPHHPGRACAA